MGDFSDNIGITDKFFPLLLKLIVDRCNGLDYLGLESCALTDLSCDALYAMCKKQPDKVWIVCINLQFNDGITSEGEDKITDDKFKKDFPIIANGMNIMI